MKEKSMKNTTTSQVNPFNYGRNMPCYCGSGIKFKKCCITNIYGNPRSQEEERRKTRQLVKLKKIQQDEHISGLRDFISGS